MFIDVKVEVDGLHVSPFCLFFLFKNEVVCAQCGLTFSFFFCWSVLQIFFWVMDKSLWAFNTLNELYPMLVSSLIVQPCKELHCFTTRFLIFSLLNFVSAINLNNKPPSSVPSGMSVVSAKLLARDVLGSILVSWCKTLT